MTWFRRGNESPPPPSGPQDAPADPLAALLQDVHQLVNLINRNAGRLPVEAVVAARRVTDLVRELIATAGERELDVYAEVAITGIVTDYLPTTLNAYLALDPELAEAARPSGRTPRESLIMQLDSLTESAADLLDATRSRDADAVLTQGNFLRTKFTRSDLDL